MRVRGRGLDWVSAWKLAATGLSSREELRVGSKEVVSGSLFS